MTEPGPLKVGVTGGIGSGKSAVCLMLREFGAPVLSADEIAREVSVRDSGARANITRLLGPQSYLPDGSYNRRFVASRIFSSRTLQRKLERIVHPLVERRIAREVAQLDPRRTPIVVVEAALVYESGLDRFLDIVVAVDADEPVRLERVRRRDGAGSKDVRSRMKAQLPVETKLHRADFVLVNNGTREELAVKVKFLYSLLQTLATERKRP